MFDFDARLRVLEDRHLLRRLTSLSSATGPTTTIDGRDVVLMASNDYLGLATHPAVVRAACAATKRFGAGSGASRLVCGTLPPHAELEATLAAFKGTESALTFGSGYLANVGVIPALIGRDGLILTDRLSHASLIEGCRLSGAEFRVYRHRDMNHLESQLRRRTRTKHVLIVTDGVFSMDGDLAPLPELATLAERYDAELYVDDAHGTGVMGQNGRGTLEHFGLEGRLPFHMGTLGKALGSSGAYVVGTRSLIHYLLNTAHAFIFTTALPPGSAAAATAAVDVLAHDRERRARLWSNRNYLFDGLHRLGFKLTDTISPIIPVLTGVPETALALSSHLLEQGVYAPAIRPPTVPKSTSRIRLTVTSEHTTVHLSQVLAAFEKAGKTLRVT